MQRGACNDEFKVLALMQLESKKMIMPSLPETSVIAEFVIDVTFLPRYVAFHKLILNKSLRENIAERGRVCNPGSRVT